jgi:hypothetical protein
MAAMSPPTADVSVRVAWSADADAIAAVQVASWRETYAGLLPPEVLDALDVAEFAEQWARSMTKPADARNRVLVALERNDVRGFAVTGPCADPDADPVTDGEIAELLVDGSTRGQGHGLPAAAGGGGHPAPGPFHPRGDVAAGRRRGRAPLPRRRGLGSRPGAPRAGPAR